MFKALTFLCLCLCLCGAAPAASPYPDPKLTPGAICKVTQEQVLKVGYTKDARHVTDGDKWKVLVRYGLAMGETIDKAKLHALLKRYEIDHFISLELGGANCIENLWPEPYEGPYGARQKDVVETGLHRLMKRGKLKLWECQAIIHRDWVAAYRALKAGKVPSLNP